MIGRVLTKLREERGLSMCQLAKRLDNISKSQLSRWENDINDPTIENAIAIADFFGISLDELVGRNSK